MGKIKALTTKMNEADLLNVIKSLGSQEEPEYMFGFDFPEVPKKKLSSPSRKL